MIRVLASWRGALAYERGSAALEFLCIGTGLLVPLVYLILAISSVQSAWMSADGLARSVASDAATAGSEEQARARVATALLVARQNRALGANDVRIEIHCAQEQVPCPQPGQLMIAHVRVVAHLPFLTDRDGFGAVTVESSASQRVSRFFPGDAVGWSTR